MRSSDALLRALGRLLLVGLLVVCGAARAELVVVMRGDAGGNERLSQNDVVDIFLGRYRQLPSGAHAVPIDQPSNSALRAEFYRRLVNKELAEINSYWARLYFSGKTAPPVAAASNADVLALLLSTPGAIAYLERRQLDARVRVVFEFSP
jgi:ABC-type phosphate transport system substrate-binding protein